MARSIQYKIGSNIDSEADAFPPHTHRADSGLLADKRAMRLRNKYVT